MGLHARKTSDEDLNARGASVSPPHWEWDLNARETSDEDVNAWKTSEATWRSEAKDKSYGEYELEWASAGGTTYGHATTPV